MTAQPAEPMPPWTIQALLDQAPIGIARGTLSGVLLYANPAMGTFTRGDAPDSGIPEGYGTGTGGTG